MKQKYILFNFLAIALVLVVASETHAIAVNQDVTLKISGKDVTMAAGSTFDTLTISSDTGSMSITTVAGQSVTLNLASRNFLVSPEISQQCGTASLGASKTYAVSIGSACSGGGGGGGGGGSTTPPPAATPPPATTPPPASTTPPPAVTPPPAITPPPPPAVTPPPATEPTVSLPAIELSMGMENTDVVKLQALLATDPSVYPEGKVTGYFGPATRRAVQRFQKKYGLSTVGRVGPATLAKLAEVFGGSITPPPAPTPATGSKLSGELYAGMSGDDVRLLQEFLAKDSALYPEGKVTGYFGPATKRAVVRFQKKYGLSPVGRVGPATLAKLNAMMASQ